MLSVCLSTANYVHVPTKNLIGAVFKQDSLIDRNNKDVHPNPRICIDKSILFCPAFLLPLTVGTQSVHSAMWVRMSAWRQKNKQTHSSGVNAEIFLNFRLIKKCFPGYLSAIRGAASPPNRSESVELGGMRAPCERGASRPGLPPKHETRALTCCPGTSPPDPAAWRTTSRSSESLYPSNIWRSRRDSQQADINEHEQDHKTSIQNAAAGLGF